jgi:hypothetical protein
VIFEENQCTVFALRKVEGKKVQHCSAERWTRDGAPNCLPQGHIGDGGTSFYLESKRRK